MGYPEHIFGTNSNMVQIWQSSAPAFLKQVIKQLLQSKSIVAAWTKIKSSFDQPNILVVVEKTTSIIKKKVTVEKKSLTNLKPNLIYFFKTFYLCCYIKTN